jgi:hypothetical protein
MKGFYYVGAGLASAVLLAAAWLATRPTTPAAEAPEPWFRDVTDEVGLDFVHDHGPKTTREYFMPGMVGSGAALIDFDNDGRLDILLLQNGGPGSKSTNRLFRQGADGKFTDVTKGSGLEVSGYGMGVAVGDVNNDGWPDVLITEYGGVRLFLNNKDGTFKDVTKEAGLENPMWGTSAAFVDYDRDGWLDLVIVNYVHYEPDKPCYGHASVKEFCGPNSFEGTVARLFRNQGRKPGAPANSVSFEDVTTRSGLSAAKTQGLGVVCADFDGDGWPDILIANDGKPNHLWVNQKDGTFKEMAAQFGVATNGMGQAQANMGVALGDLDGDGLFDVLITHLPEELNVCWKQGPRGIFQDRTTQMGLGNPRWRGTGFGVVFGDFDNDGALDIAVANGAVRQPQRAAPPGTELFWDRYYERNQLFANDGKGKFRDISEGDPFCAEPHVWRGLACGDVFNDGSLALLVTRVGASARLYRNVAAKRGHWLLVRVVDPALGERDAYGAEVVVEAGSRRWKRWANPASSYLCSNDPRVHFGLGPAERVDAIKVLWPDGKAELFPGRAADQRVVLRKGEGEAIPSLDAPRAR